MSEATAVSFASSRGAAGQQRPTLAPGVRLVGPVEGGGFVDRQWLVQRDGRFIQLTELLYRVAESADGARTADDIAEAVTASSDWLVTGEDVLHLIEMKLEPIGLVVARAEPNSERVARAAAQSPSPLAVNLRMKTVGPRVIDPITAVLQYLFAPPLLVPLTMLAVGTQVWLFTAHGFVGATIDALYTRGFLLVSLALMLIAGIVHEFGHAAALRYGGGRARRIGAGFYLIFPAFFTDVTDTYRLGRWARVRTGLGGIYFHLLFALALVSVAFVTGHEFLLFVVLLIDLEIVRQLIPLVRLDGYWVLADLTGVPDFVSLAAPFVRSLVPAGRVSGPRLPKLKPLAKGVFLAYLVITVPALGFLLFLTIRYLPRILTTLWDAILTQATLFSDAHEAGDVLQMITAAAELVILALPLVGMAYLLYLLVWKPMKLVLMQRSKLRRTIGAVAVAAALAAIGYSWAPQLPTATGAVPAGVRSYDDLPRAHVRGRVHYAQTPPVGGNHSPVWQNCGFYDRPVRNENAVHSLEHGAIWITYRPNLPSRERAFLKHLADHERYILVSPYAGLPAQVVASAWGRQLRLDSTADARLQRFIDAFRLHSPERGRPCSGGTGIPR